MVVVYEDFIINVLNMNPKKAKLSDINLALQKDHLDGAIMEGFNLYIFMNSLWAADPKVGDQMLQKFEEGKNSKDMEQIAFHFFKCHTGTIECIINDVLQKAYFPIKPICRYLSEASQENLILTVNRSSLQHKIMGLIKRVPDLIDEMKHLEKLSRS